MGKTSIEWAANADGTPGATWNPIRARDKETGLTGTFCVHKSDGCKNCYAETMQQRKLPGNGIGLAYVAQNLPRVEFFLNEKMLTAPLRRQKPTTYFLSSMTDVFGEFVPDEMIDKLWAVMAVSPQHTFIVVTKRADRMQRYFSEAFGRDGSTINRSKRDNGFCIEREMRIREAMAPHTASIGYAVSVVPVSFPLPNVWLVVSAEDQKTAEERIPMLLLTPAAVRGVSCEPLLGPINLSRLDCSIFDTADTYDVLRGFSYRIPWERETRRIKLDWIICGGESGNSARPRHPFWASSLRDQCAAAGVPYFDKQHGEWAPVCDMTEEQIESCYPPISERHPDATRRAKVPTTVLHYDGSQHEIASPSAYEQGAQPMLMFKVGKHRSGRLLAGVEHNGRPPL